MIVLLDSWAWIEYFRNGEKAKEVAIYLESEREIYISAINVAEVFRALLSSETKQLAEKLVVWMIHRSIIIPVSTEIALQSAELKHKHKWGLGDSIVYATALNQKTELLTGDSDFKGMDGVIYFGK